MKKTEVVRLTWHGLSRTGDGEWRWDLGLAQAERYLGGWWNHEDGTQYQHGGVGAYAATAPEEALANAKARMRREIEDAEGRIRAAQEELKVARKLMCQLEEQESSLRDNSATELECIRLVRGFFDGDRSKTRLWFATPNPLLGGVKPNDLFGLGRHEKLLKFIRTQLAENRPPA